ncbi:MAG TPA: DUF4410 domain-containing protein [Thermodesulfobacteriota bacterium]|nr:DUF4410 domain-containing protein [Thermodesulfobacteriota bacterium]
MKSHRLNVKELGCLFCVCVLIIALTGCGAGKTMVLKPSEDRLHVSSVEISEKDSTVNAPIEAKSSFQEMLTKFLYESGGFQKGSDLKIQYRFVQYSPGSQLTRWFWGGLGNMGEGALTIEAKYFDSNGKEIATIQSEGKIGSGVFGGSFNFAIEKCAKEIAEYTKQNFK